MATRYWIGGTGTWDTSSTTNWSASSGGSAGASAPTSADDVVIDAQSETGTITCTNAVCANLTVTASQAITLGASASSLSVYGNLSFPSEGSFAASNTSFTITFAATATGKTITTNGKTLGGINFNGLGGGWTLSDALTTNGSTTGITISNGTFNTNGFPVSTGTISVGGGTTRVLTLGSSSITCSSAWTVSSTTGFTLNANTSTITLSAAGTTFTGGGLTYYNVSFSSTSSTTVIITGANTFNNLSFTSAATSSIKSITVGANQTVNGTLTANGGSVIRRFFIRSDTVGTARTITAAAESLSNCDFRDITAAGAASPFTGTGLGNCKGNTNITFPAAKTVYWNLGGSTQNWSATAWATSSGGTPALANFPLAQDTVVINNTGTVPSTAIQIETNWNIGTLNMSNRTSAVTITHPGVPTIYGNFTVGTGVSLPSSATLIFSGRTTQTITTAGKTFPFPVNIDSPGGTVQLDGNFTSSVAAASVALTLTRGTFDAVTYDLSLSQFSSSNSNARTINMGSGTWTLTGTALVWTTNTLTNLTLNKQTSNIVISNTSTTSRSFASGGNSLSFPKISFYLAGYTLTFTNAISMDELASIPFSTANTITFSTNSASTVGTWSVKGVSGTVPNITSATSGTTATVNVTNKTTSDIDYLYFRDISCSTLTPVTFYVGANSVNTSNNNGVAFVAPSSTEVQILTSGTSWTVPSGFGSSNTIHLFGGGGGGGGSRISGSNRAAGGGAGGGGYTQISNVSLTPSSSINIAIGSGGANGTPGATGGTTQIVLNPITYIANNKVQNTSSGTSLVINKPTGTIDSDLLIAYVSNSAGSGTWTSPAGWTERYDANGFSIYTKTASSEGADYTFTSSTAGALQGYVLTYRYADFDKIGSTTGPGSGALSAPSISLTENYSYVLAYYVNTNNTGVTYTTPTNYTSIVSDSDTTRPSSAIFGRGGLSPGATGTVSSTASTGTTNYGILLGIKSTDIYSAYGGTGGGANTTPGSTAGTGGAGSTYNGGNGGLGATSTASSGVVGGGGAGGAGGPNGVGKNGGTGRAGGASDEMGSGGGGGNGGGTNGGNASSNLGGNGGNNSLGTGGAIGTSGSGASGTFGGGGAGAGGGSSTGGSGGSGIEILNSFGGAGGAGGTSTTNALSNTGLYGGGGGGAGASGTTQRAGGNGSQGAIIIVYTSGTAFSDSVTEDISTGDTNAVVLTLNTTVTENMSVASVESVLAAFFLNLTETITANDGRVANLATATSVTESFDISTLISGGIASNASVTENTGISALNTELVVFSGSITENVGMADIRSAVSAFSTSIAEALGINDVRQANTAFPAVMVEALVVDSAEAAASAFAAVMVENTTLADIRTIGSAYFETQTENLTPESIQSGILTFIASVVENVNLEGNQSVTVAFSASIAEPVTMQDNTATYGWFKINDDQTANWAVIGTTDTPNWVIIDNTQNGNWQNINNDQG